MSAKRTALLAGVGILLAVTVLTGNLLILADRTVLDAEFAKSTAEDQGLHEQFAESLRQDAGDGATPVNDALTDQYVKTQIDANIDRFYGYLHGDRSELRLYFELEPVKEEVARDLAAENEDLDRETARAQLDEEMPDRQVFTEGMDGGTESTLETARSVVSVLSVLTYVVPLLGLALAAGFVRVAPSREVAAYGIGAVVGVVGLLGAAVASVAPNQMRSLLGAGGDPGSGLVLAATDRISGALLEQSLVLLLLGIAVIAAGIAYRKEYLPVDRA